MSLKLNVFFILFSKFVCVCEIEREEARRRQEGRENKWSTGEGSRGRDGKGKLRKGERKKKGFTVQGFHGNSPLPFGARCPTYLLTISK